MKRLLLITMGLISIGAGVLGIFVPGLPTTIFLLIAAWAFARSSRKLYTWLCAHKVLGKYISEYNKHKSMKMSTKLYAISMMWGMILLSTIFVLYPRMGWKITVIMGALGAIGTISVFLVPTRKTPALIETPNPPTSQPKV